MSTPLSVSAKDLGELALPGYCPRCLWIKIKSKTTGGLPYQKFPGIFSAIDTYSKNIVHDFIDQNKQAPDYLKPLGQINKYIIPPHYSKFLRIHEETGITLRGSPDAIFALDDRSYIIADYKTAKFTNTQDSLLPMYEVQLNVYAYIGEANHITPVNSLALLYFEPITDLSASNDQNYHTNHGFNMPFHCFIKTITKQQKRIDGLLKEFHLIATSFNPPHSNTDCNECVRLDNIIAMITKIQN